MGVLTIWGRKNSSNVQAVMWCVGELGLAHRRHDIGHKYGGNDTPEFLAMNPNGLVPVVQDDENEPMWESAAILRYLAGRYAAAPFWPQNLAARAKVDQWAEWARMNIAPNFTTPIFWRVARTAPQDRDEAAIAQAIVVLAKKLDIAETRLKDYPFLVADELTLADIQFGHLLYRYFDLPIARPEHPALRRYYDRLTERPAYAEHVMVSYDDLKVS